MRKTESSRREMAGSRKVVEQVSRSHPNPPQIFAFYPFLFTVGLDVGIPLPQVLNVNFGNAVLEVIEVSFPCKWCLDGP